MLFGNQRITQRIVLVVIFDQRVRQRLTLLDPQALGDRTGGDIADHHFDRNNLNLADQLLAHVEAADEVGRDADMRQAGEYIFADAVVDHALAIDRAALLRVEGGRIVLEILDDRAGLRAFIQDLGLAFVNLAATRHRHFLKNGKPRLRRVAKGDCARPGRTMVAYAKMLRCAISRSANGIDKR